MGCGSALAAVVPKAASSPAAGLDELTARIAKLEARLPNSQVIHKKFWPRAFAILGHQLAVGLLIQIPIVVIFMIIIAVAAMAGR
jgi:hypothetical protein